MNRRIYGQWQHNIPSRFINELPPRNIEICNKASCFGGGCQDNYQQQNQYKSSSNWYNLKQNNNTIQDSDRFSYVRDDDAWSSGNYYQAKRNAKNATAAMPIGSRVYHSTFGYGKVLNIEGNKLEIWFDKFGHKKLLKDYLTKA